MQKEIKMKKNFFKSIALLTALIFISSCATKTTVPDVIITPELPPVESNLNLFESKTSLTWLKEVAIKANCVLNHPKTQEAISKVTKFDYSNENGVDVLLKMQAHKAVIRSYKTSNPWSKVIATTYTSNRIDMYFNTRNNPRAMAKMVNTACHEKTHLVGYSHGNNSSVGKQNSVPYYVGKLCEQNYYLCQD